MTPPVMDGNRGNALRGCALVCVLICPASAAAQTPAVAPATTRAAVARAANNAVFSTNCPGADAMPSAANRTQARMATVCLLNRIRAAAGLPQLTTVRALRRIAAAHSRDMVIRRYFDHTGPGDLTLARRLATVSWRGAAGENLGFGTCYYATPRSMVWGWMRSSGHRENIMDPEFHYIGVAIALGAPETIPGPAATYTTDFGAL
jgi:uncharacterized protein YkwD